jgi:hypothetical protein
MEANGAFKSYELQQKLVGEIDLRVSLQFPLMVHLAPSMPLLDYMLTNATISLLLNMLLLNMDLVNFECFLQMVNSILFLMLFSIKRVVSLQIQLELF